MYLGLLWKENWNLPAQINEIRIEALKISPERMLLRVPIHEVSTVEGQAKKNMWKTQLIIKYQEVKIPLKSWL